MWETKVEASRAIQALVHEGKVRGKVLTVKKGRRQQTDSRSLALAALSTVNTFTNPLLKMHLGLGVEAMLVHRGQSFPL